MPDAAAHDRSPARSPSPTAPFVTPPVHVVGAGPGGLATAAALRARGVRAVVLEKSDGVAASWRGHYDRLRLHTTRRLSSLPGLVIPRAYGRWVGRDDVVRYLEQYAEHHRLEIVTGAEVRRIDPATPHRKEPPTGQANTPTRHDSFAVDHSRSASPGHFAPATAHDNGHPHTHRWTLHITGDRTLTSAPVIVATGFNHTPHLPDWPGRATYTGELLHAAHYRNPRPYVGKDVLVVGTGNTGAEIAADLAHGGAARVWLAVRTPPHIVRRSTAGWPAQATGILVRRLPPHTVDRAARVMRRLSIPDLAPYGLPAPETGLYSRALQGAIPVQDVGLIDAVRGGLVRPVAAVESFDGDEVRLADGSVLRPEVVIAATGYRRGLDSLVGHLGVLDSRGRPRVHGPDTLPTAPGLRFTGYTNPISGMFRELALDARRIARAVAGVA
ncbi:NAD(P)/FAD-dependent oxidoreductase [Streptomyces sp. NPDC003077]|uniref:flavin-containing monooxygenase n=1 Tax=Streptomyces sp. NPDC003077 TaxID=3154443 RepID=UPI0033B980A8